MKKLKILSGLTVTAVLAAGCITYDQELILNEDGSGTVLVRYASDDPEGKVGAPVLSFTEEEIETEYAGSGVRVRNIQVYVAPVTREGPSEAKYYIDFEDIGDLNGHGVFAAKDCAGTEDAITQVFTLDEEGGTTTFTQTCTIDMDLEEASSYDKDLSAFKDYYTFTYTLTCPSAVTMTNGDVKLDGRTVTWSYSLMELIENPVGMYAVYGDSGETGNGQGSIGPGKLDEAVGGTDEGADIPGPTFDIEYTEAPYMTYDVKPEYPETAKASGWEGDVVLCVYIDRDGNVKNAIVAGSSGFADVDDEAVKAAYKYRFSPAKQQGVPVGVWYSVVIEFRL